MSIESELFDSGFFFPPPFEFDFESLKSFDSSTDSLEALKNKETDE